jgi:hypothetical protein
MQKEQLINEMAEAISQGAGNNTHETIAEFWDILAKAAIAAIQDKCIIVEKSKVEIVDNNNITLHIGDLLQGKKLYTQIVDRFMIVNQDYYADYKVIQRNGKPAINKTDIVGE